MVLKGSAPSQGTKVDELAKQVAQAALRLAAMPADALRADPQALDAIEQLAKRMLNEVAAIRMTRAVGESRGAWRVMQPGRQ
ncbi:MAG: hypothetical protein KGN36_20370 [Acidobacteriota bacterium]|nr:hypothetical protein [Acidobacteriota bacterium]